MSDISNELTFEDLRNENGMSFWYASDFQLVLNYSSFPSFDKVIQKASKALMSLNIPAHDNIIPVMNPDTGHQDYKLSRFACYLIAMNADPKKEEVAKAQAYFASMTRSFEKMMENSDQIDRVVFRDEIKEGNTALSKAAHRAGVQNFAYFQNAGYVGMYNMNNWQLANRRNIDKTKLFDHMGRTELAANLFRITMTEEKIKNESIKGQASLERAHMSIGREVRKMVIDNTGKTPENLPVEKRLPEVRKEIKQNYKEIKSQDKK
jgi:DNA-damage-inducible protein D